MNFNTGIFQSTYDDSEIRRIHRPIGSIKMPSEVYTSGSYWINQDLLATQQVKWISLTS